MKRSLFVSILVLAVALVSALPVAAQDEDPQPHKIYLPGVNNSRDERIGARFVLDTKPLNVYAEDTDGVCDGMKDGSTKTADKRHFCLDEIGSADFRFLSGTYFGYFRDAGFIKDIANGGEWRKVIAVTVDKDVEELMISTFRSTYPGAVVFVQRLTSTTKMVVYVPGVFPNVAAE